MTMALCRPIEITTSNKDFSISYDGGGAVAKALPTGAYASILTVLDELEDQIQATAAGADVYLTSDWKVAISAGAGHTLAITWTDVALGLLLGFDGDCTAALLSTAAYTPEYCWLPTFEASDPEAWAYTPQFSGATSVSGLLSGISLASGRYRRTPKWSVERDYNARIARAETVDTFGATTFYPEQRRCFEQFIADVKNAAPADDASEGLNLKGFYLIHDRSVYTGTSPTVAIPSSMTSGGVDTEFSSSPDRYVYCSIEASAQPEIVLSADGQNLYYDVSIPVHTATAPSWNQP